MIKATYADKDYVVDILHSAFEPITSPNSINFIVKQDQKRSKRIRVLMEFLFEDSMASGEVLLSSNRNACILVKYPHMEKMSWNWLTWQFKLAFQVIGFNNIFKILKRLAEIKKHHIKEPYIHPVIMGAKSDVNGRGIGVRLIRQLIDHYPDNKLPIIIETTTDENLRIYNRFGFEVFKKIETKDFPLYFLRMN